MNDYDKLKQQNTELAAMVAVMRTPLEGMTEYLAALPSAGFAVLAMVEAGREALSITGPAALHEVRAKVLEEILGNTDPAGSPQDFRLWLAENVPAGTVIGDPHWWANRIWNAAIRAARAAAERAKGEK